jgi:hypothetical protein
MSTTPSWPWWAFRGSAWCHSSRLGDGVVLVDRPELHGPRAEHARWLNWLAGLAGTNQLFVTTA